MTAYRIIVPQAGKAFVEYRARFPWPHWKRERRWVCDGFDIVPEALEFDTASEAAAWVAEAEQAATTSAFDSLRDQPNPPQPL